MPRRKAVVYAIAGVIAALGGALAAVAGTFLSNSWRVKQESSSVAAGSFTALSETDFLRVVVPVTRRQGWATRTLQRTVYLRRSADGAAQAFLATCSHMGCQVRWETASASFRCPCHEGRFDESGAVLSGPPPRGLQPVDATVEDGQVMVRLS